MFNWPRRTAHSGHSICLYKILLIMLSLPSMANTDKTVFFYKRIHSLEHIAFPGPAVTLRPTIQC